MYSSNKMPIFISIQTYVYIKYVKYAYLYKMRYLYSMQFGSPWKMCIYYIQRILMTYLKAVLFRKFIILFPKQKRRIYSDDSYLTTKNVTLKTGKTKKYFINIFEMLCYSVIAFNLSTNLITILSVSWYFIFDRES